MEVVKMRVYLFWNEGHWLVMIENVKENFGWEFPVENYKSAFFWKKYESELTTDFIDAVYE